MSIHTPTLRTPLLSLVSHGRAVGSPTQAPEEGLVVGCDGCPARASTACDDCFVAVMLRPAASAADRGHGRG